MNIKGSILKIAEPYKSNPLSVRFANLLSIDMFVKLTGLSLMFIYMNIMSVSEYAIYNIIFSLISAAGLFLNFGMYIAQATYYHEYRENIGVLIYNLNLVLVFLFSSLAIFFYFTSYDIKLLSFILGKDLNINQIISFRIWIWIWAILQSFVFMLSNYLVMNVNKIRVFQVYSVTKVLLINVVALYGVNYLFGDKSVIRTKYSALTELIVTIPFLVYYFSKINLKFDLKVLKKSFFVGLPAMCTAFITSIQSLVDKRFLLEYIGSTESGVYIYCAVLTGNLWVLAQSFNSAYLPTVLKETDTKKSFLDTLRISKKVLLLIVLAAVSMFVFALVIDYLSIVNLKYKEAIIYMPLMLLSQVILASSSIWANYFFYFKSLHMQFISVLLSLLVSILACYFFVPKLYIWGAVIASVLSSLAGLIFNFLYAYYQCLHLKK